jgi:beta-glucanase (GH16 family)
LPPASTTPAPPSATTSTPKTPSHGALIWSDDFNGIAGALPDAEKWTEEYGPAAYRNNELQCYTNNNPNNASLDGNGALRITVRRKPNSCGKDYTSASLWTKDKFDFLHGYLEARIKTPSGSGLWPAFWTQGSTGSWPDHGELDIMEKVNSDAGTVELAHGGPIHWMQYQHSSVPPRDNKWHTYAAKISTGKVEFYLDGSLSYTATSAAVPAGGVWPYDSYRQLLRLNVAMGGDYPGGPDGSAVLPASMLVDWVRVYAN